MADVNLLNSTAAQREALFISLYKKAFPLVAKYVSKMGGSFDDAKDIFQDALVVWYEKMINGSLAPNTNEQAYLLGISKHLWLKKFRDDILVVSLEDSNVDNCMDDDYAEPSPAKLLHYLETAGQKCMDILRAFYYDKLSVNTIAGLFGYNGVRSATVQKYKCLEKVRETIKEKSLTYEDFIE